VFIHDFLAILDEEDGFFDKQASLVLAHALRESPQRWCCSLPADNMHSLGHFYDLIKDNFHHFDPKYLEQKLLQQKKDLHELPMEFWQCFRDLHFQAPKIQMKFTYLWDRFEYWLNKSIHPKRKFEPKPHSTYFSDGAAQS